MKRSIIIQEIIQQLKDNDMSDGPSLQSAAEHILHKLEELGMLPPDIAHCHCEDCNGGPLHSWSEEDET